MNCDELLSLLNEYVDGETAAGLCVEFERHLAGCNPCQVVVDNIRKTITLVRNGESFEIPVELTKRLREVLRDRWNRRQSPNDSQ